ncbi:hypothetical protein L204_102017 [Cryptococcus depauperatus]
MSITKGVILVGGPTKGTRMRPLTLDSSEVTLAPETLVRSCIVLPNKSLTKDAYNQVLL